MLDVLKKRMRQGLLWLSKLYARQIEARAFRWRLSKRLLFYQVQSPDHLPVMTVKCYGSLQEDADHSACTDFMCAHGGFFSRLYGTTTALAQNQPPKLRPNVSTFTMHGIVLEQYKDFQHYKRALGKRSSFFLRQANKALKAGFSVQAFSPANHSADMVAIRRSMKIRSFGVMSDAWLANIDQFGGMPLQWTHPTVARCTQHWERFFGIFTARPGYKQGVLAVDQQLVGYARLHRIGNMLTYRDFIGDGRFLSAGIMKLLHVSVMQWLLDSGDTDAVGIENFAYGSIERGGQGIFFWKKKALFAPYRVNIIEFALPDDFNSQQYLELHRDVALAGHDAARHYQDHGQFEKRVYRRD